MKKHLRLKICSCGRLHFYDQNRVDEAITNNKEVIFVCGCGRITKWGASEEFDYFGDGKMCYNVYSEEIKSPTTWNSKTFTETDGKKAISEIIYSPGKKVMMKTGYYASAYVNDEFEDMLYPDFWKIEKNNITPNEVLNWIEEHRRDRKTVNMNWLLRELTEEEAMLLHSSYYIKAFDWSKTKLGPQPF
jgi:hypothetical protein